VPQRRSRHGVAQWGRDRTGWVAAAPGQSRHRDGAVEHRAPLVELHLVGLRGDPPRRQVDRDVLRSERHRVHRLVDLGQVIVLQDRDPGEHPRVGPAALEMHDDETPLVAVTVKVVPACVPVRVFPSVPVNLGLEVAVGRPVTCKVGVLPPPLSMWQLKWD